MLWKDDLLSKLRTVTDQMNIIQLDRDQLSTRLDQLQKVVQDVEEGKNLTWSLTHLAAALHLLVQVKHACL